MLQRPQKSSKNTAKHSNSALQLEKSPYKNIYIQKAKCNMQSQTLLTITSVIPFTYLSAIFLHLKSKLFAESPIGKSNLSLKYLTMPCSSKSTGTRYVEETSWIHITWLMIKTPYLSGMTLIGHRMSSRISQNL